MKPLLPIGVWADGTPAVPEVNASTLARMAKADVEGWQRTVVDAVVESSKVEHLGYVGQPGPGWRDPTAAEVGWGVVFFSKVTAEVRETLQPLIVHRKGKVLPDWQPLDSAIGWLNHQGLTIKNHDPALLPYYILLVGTPLQISFADQYQLHRIRAVGRLDLADAAAYKSYVDAVIAQESAPAAGKRVVVAAPRNGDEPTHLTAEYLAPAVAHHVNAASALASLNYSVQLLDKATCGDIKLALSPDTAGHTPALAFVAGHGLRSKEVSKQGAWIGSEWHQPTGGAVPDSALLSAGTVGPEFYAAGSIICSLACYGAGSPKKSDYATYFNAVVTDPKRRLDEIVAEKPFTAELPRQLLSYRQSGDPAACLAFVGHVDVSWPTAFYDFQAEKADTWVFKEFVEAVLQGDTVGMATEVFKRIQEDQNAELADRTSKTGKLNISDEPAVAQAWIDRNNARGYIVLGDPAVRIDPSHLG